MSSPVRESQSVAHVRASPHRRRPLRWKAAGNAGAVRSLRARGGEYRVRASSPGEDAHRVPNANVVRANNAAAALVGRPSRPRTPPRVAAISTDRYDVASDSRALLSAHVAEGDRCGVSRLARRGVCGRQPSTSRARVTPWLLVTVFGSIPDVSRSIRAVSNTVRELHKCSRRATEFAARQVAVNSTAVEYDWKRYRTRVEAVCRQLDALCGSLARMSARGR